MNQSLEFYIIPVGEHIAEGNKAVWMFLAELGEGTQEKGNAQIQYEGKKVQGIRVSRSIMETIRDSKKDYHFQFLILSIHLVTGEVRQHFSSHAGIWDKEKRRIDQQIKNRGERVAKTIALALPDDRQLLCPGCGRPCSQSGSTIVKMGFIRNFSGFAQPSYHGVPVSLVVSCVCGVNGMAPIVARDDKQ